MAVNVLRNGQSIYMREQPFGGNQLTQEIQNQFGLSPEEAEAAKRDGGLPENYESEVLQPFIDKMGLEIARALQFFFTSTPVQPGEPHRACPAAAPRSRASMRRSPSAPRSDDHRGQSVRQHGGFVQDQAEEPHAATRPR